MLMWTDWTNWDENLSSDEVKHLSHKKADKGWRCKAKTLGLSRRIFTCLNLSFWTLLSPQKEILEKIGHLEGCLSQESCMSSKLSSLLISKHEMWQKIIFGTNCATVTGQFRWFGPHSRALQQSELKTANRNAFFFLICYSSHKWFTFCTRPVNCLSGFKGMMAQL